MAILNKYFETATEARVRIMAKKWNIRLIIRGNRCCTDGEFIYIPQMMDAPDELLTDIDGMVDHEVAHCIFTDFPAMKQIENRFHGELFNCLEDSRIEILLPMKYPGTKRSLDRLNAKWRAKSDLVRHKKNDDGKYLMPWPLRLVRCIREIYDGRTPQTDPQIEPILSKIIPDIIALRDCKNSATLIRETELLRQKINKIREDMFDDSFSIDDDELDKLMEAMQELGMEFEVPVELDPDRKKRKGKKAEGQEQYDPAVEKAEDENGDESGEESEEGSADGDADEEKDGKAGKKSKDSKEQNTDSDADSDDDSESGEASSDKDNSEGDEADESADGSEGTNQSDKDSEESNQDESDGTGVDKSEESGDGTDEETEVDGDSGSDSNEDTPAGVGKNKKQADELDKLDELESDEDPASDLGTGSDDDSTDSDSGDTENTGKAPEVDEDQLAKRSQVSPHFEGQESHRKTEDRIDENIAYKKSQRNALREQIMKNAAELPAEESEVESDMLETEMDETGTEFDKHVFSAESYIDIELEQAEEFIVDKNRHKGWYDDDVIDEKMVLVPFSRDYDKVIDLNDQGDNEQYASRKKMLMPYVVPIQMELERTLKVKENKRERYERERGQLNGRVLYKLATDRNYRTPFKDTIQKETKDVAVCLLFDCSGSMAGGKMELARQTGIVLAEALDSIHIPFECLGFNTEGSQELMQAVRDSGLSDEQLKRFDRTHTGLRLMVFKSFATKSLNGILKAESGGANADSESVLWAAKRLALRPEKRKVMIVMSDGQPASEGSSAVQCGDLKRVVSLLPKAGIEVIGVGIQCDSPKLFYPKHVVVDEISELPTRVMSELSKILIDGIK